MKYSEAEKQIKALSSKYNVNMEDGDFIVNYKNMLVAWVKNNKRYSLYNNENCFKKIPFSNKLYMILAELAITQLDERVEEKKQYVHALKGHSGYLCITPSNEVCFSNKYIKFYKCDFTVSEIERLKKRDDIPLDWNKVKLEETNED